MALLDMKDVRGGYGDADILHGVSMTVGEREIVVIVGPNGAGKSTAMKSVFGLLAIRGGHIVFDGEDITAWAPDRIVQRGICYVPQVDNVFREMTVHQNFEMGAFLRRGDLSAAYDRVYGLFPDLKAKRKNLAGDLSGGQRQMVAMGRALMLDPKLLLLDEPTAGLDPLMELVFQDCIREARAAGTTVLLSSHILAQVEVLADRISIVRAGQVVETGSLDDLRHMTRTSIVARTDHPADGMQSLTGVHDVTVTDDEVRLEVDGEHVGPVIRRLSELGLRSITAHPPTLEQLLVSHYGEQPQATSGGAESNHSRRSVGEGAAQEGSVEEVAAQEGSVEEGAAR